MLQSDEKEKASASDKPAGNAELLKNLKPFLENGFQKPGQDFHEEKPFKPGNH
jgi:hypothetical protein